MVFFVIAHGCKMSNEQWPYCTYAVLVQFVFASRWSGIVESISGLNRVEYNIFFHKM